LRGLFVTGTDTGVGKTVLTAAIVAALRADGVATAAVKPVMTGLDEPAQAQWPHDHELLARIDGRRPAEVAPLTFGPAVSPHLAAELSGAPVAPEQIEAAIRAAAADADVVVVEGVGGLLVPLSGTYDVRALARALGLPLVIAARPGLGTINHALLTLEAARAAELAVAGVVLTPWPRAPGMIEQSNRETIGRLGRVEVAALPRVECTGPECFVGAGLALPIARWLKALATADSLQSEDE
jgi:dethiobiotin synthetase